MYDFFVSAAFILGNRDLSDAKKISLLKEELKSATERNERPNEDGEIIDGLEVTAADLDDLEFDKLRSPYQVF